jgi:hypothetical protein
MVKLPSNYALRQIENKRFLLVEKHTTIKTGLVRAGAYTSERQVVSYPKELREEVEEIAAYDSISRSPDVSDDSRAAARLRVAQICAKHNPKLHFAANGDKTGNRTGEDEQQEKRS